jgi:vacuolar-type H+-ATPase subunit E/Vma4
LANNSKEARDRAEASFKKQEQRAREGAKAMADYEAEGRAMREKTARLKSLRMAKQAAGKEVVEGSEPANSRSPSSAMKPLP